MRLSMKDSHYPSDYLFPDDVSASNGKNVKLLCVLAVVVLPLTFPIQLNIGLNPIPAPAFSEKEVKESESGESRGSSISRLLNFGTSRRLPITRQPSGPKQRTARTPNPKRSSTEPTVDI